MTYLINDLINDRLPNESISDELIKKLSYAIRYFELWTTDLSERDYWWKMQPILINRLDELEKKPIVAKMAILKSSELSGQLWQDCEFCGSDGPVYISHGCRCEKCLK